jgi:hypothetical protein
MHQAQDKVPNFFFSHCLIAQFYGQLNPQQICSPDFPGIPAAVSPPSHKDTEKNCMNPKTEDGTYRGGQPFMDILKNISILFGFYEITTYIKKDYDFVDVTKHKADCFITHFPFCCNYFRQPSRLHRFRRSMKIYNLTLSNIGNMYYNLRI